jgi:hypothetical protein
MILRFGERSAQVNRRYGTVSIAGAPCHQILLVDRVQGRRGVSAPPATSTRPLGATNEGALGARDEVDPIKHLLYTAGGWVGCP